jgi:asparaginyl-tRNA synthetase
MAERVWIEEISDHEGEEVTLYGWLYNRRSSGKLHFLQVRDGTGVIQCVVFQGDAPQEVFALAGGLSQESAVQVTGAVKKDKRSPIGYELSVSHVTLVNESTDYPIGPKEHGVAFLMDNRHLWLRSSRQHAILRIRHEVIRAVRDFFDDRGFTLLDAPVFTPNACEGTTTLFSTEYFNTRAYLTQSGQLYNEAGAMGFGKVYCFGPTFRAEKSKTRRHLTEFWMVEPEMAYCDLEQTMDLAEVFVEYVVQRVVDRRRRELETLERAPALLERVQRPFPRISYSEAIDILRGKGNETTWGEDFGGDEETVISAEFDRPVMIHRYPAQCKAFYMKNDPAHPELALCVDMLAPEGYGEIIGGGQREDDYQTLHGKIEAHQLSPETFQWYLDLRQYGSVPHAGFGMGIERAVAWICGLKHVRETIPFPRMMERLTP